MSTKLVFDGKAIKSEADFHDVIDRAARAVGFEGYGRNLDAALDVLSGFLPPPVEVQWLKSESCRHALGDRFDQIVSVLRCAEERLGSSFRWSIEP